MRAGRTIFDCVVHVHNLREDNIIETDGRIAQNNIYRLTRLAKRGIEKPPEYSEFAVDWSPERIGELLFHEKSEIDYAMVQTVPLFELYRDGLDVVEKQHRLAQLYPDKVIFCGGTDPVLRGTAGALADIDRQIGELGARSIKFYNAHSRGRSWSMDDPFIAYPLFERMLEHGVNVVQVHKGNPMGPEPLTALHAHDVAEAALRYPEINFIVHHLGVPYEDETILIAARIPNVYLATSTWINSILLAPIPTAQRIGKVLYYCGSEKLIWGSETPLWQNPQRLLEVLWDFQISDEMQDGYGYPAITDEDRTNIFGGNMLRLLGMPAKAVADGAA
jgi:predicted TIM-barrel fold metal-dependent hydrolase